MLAMLMLVMVQTVPGPPGDEAVVPRMTQEPRCRRGDEEIMVCGGGLQSQRLEPLPEMKVDPLLPAAAVHLSGGKTLTAHGEEGGGYTAVPRAMVTLKVPF